MDGWDFSILWSAGRALLEGHSPYTVADFFYPLPFAYFIAFVALLPMPVALGLWQIANVGMMIAALRKRFWQWLLYIPVLHVLSSGQVDLLFWFMARGLGRHWRGALLGALMTMKPHAAMVLLTWHLLDWLRHDRRTLWRWLVLTILLWMPAFIINPNWPGEMMVNVPHSNWLLSVSNTPGIFSLARLVPDLWPLLAVAAVVVFVWGQFQTMPVARACALLAMPIGMFYSTMTLMDTAPAWLLVPLGLIATVLSLLTRTIIPFMAIPLATLAWHYYQRRAAAPTPQPAPI